MKNKSDNWLGFFKKTLKISGYVFLRILVIAGILIYTVINHDNKTYLACKEKGYDTLYLAFNKYKVFNDWNPMEEKWDNNYDIILMNKKEIKAKFYAYQTDNPNEMIVADSFFVKLKFPKARFVTEGYFNLDRETGKLKITFDNGYKGNTSDCDKISKRKLPKTNIKQKF